MFSVEEGQLFKLRAVYRSDFEESLLVDETGCLVPLEFWVDFENGWGESSNRAAYQLFEAADWGDKLAVVFEGSYECSKSGHYGYGHMDFYPCQLNVHAVKRVLGRVVASPGEAQ